MRGTLKTSILSLFLALILLVSGCAAPAPAPDAPTEPSTSINLASIPPFSGEPSVELDNNSPNFTEADLAREPFEEFAPLDNLNRCGTAFALLGPESMPTEPRGSTNSVRPSGWHLVKYDIVDGKYLFNRCHLIAYRLCGENANECNLITGTRFLNIEGMLPYENTVADYIETTGNRVLMRVTPIFEGDELVARGVQLEAQSVEDDGTGVSFNVYAYNVQPGITIDYATGENTLDGTVAPDEPALDTSQYAYILNVGTKRFHLPDCPSLNDMKEKNKRGFNGTRDEALAKGYEPCGRCNP